jgi:hypothetical protein
MLKLLNALAIIGLIGTAGWAYSIKYETIYFAEQVKKIERRVEREKEAIAVLQAEWQHLNTPSRLQALTDRHLPLAPIQAAQIIRPADLPNKAADSDPLARKLDELLTGSVGTRPAVMRRQPTPAQPVATPRPRPAGPVSLQPPVRR